jgi:hypothetical protein
MLRAIFGAKTADMMLQLTANVPNGVILQLATCTSKGVTYCEKRIGLAFVRGRRAVHIDFSAIGQGEMDMDLIDAARVMIASGRFHRHTARDQAVENVLELRLVFNDDASQGFVGLRAMKVDL